MKTYTIAPTPRVTFLGLGSAYFATFGALWLFVEPLGAFGLIPPLSKQSGFLMYVFLLAVPALALPAFLRWHRWYKIHNLPFVHLSVRSTADGITYSLRVAENMQVTELLHQYTEILRRGPARSNVEATLRRYYPVLQIKRDDAFVDVDCNMTLHAAGIQDGEACQVRGQEYEHLNQVMFSRRSPQ